MTKNLWWNRPQTDDCVLRNDTGEYWRVRVGKTEQLLHNDYIEVLREYFRDERDRELGVWRWGNERGKQYLVSKLGYGDKFRVVREEHYEQLDWAPEQYNSLAHSGNDMVKAIQAYQEAHHEKKPWHDAKPGEVWELTTTHIPNKVTAWSTFEGVFMDESQNWVTGMDILDGRRIWSESKES